MIDEVTGKPSLKRRRAKVAEAAVLALEEAIKERMPERTLLEILARTAYIIEGLLRNVSDAQPDTIHADTQGQSYPMHALAHLFGFDLLTRIRNWKDLTFYRHAADVRYKAFRELGRVIRTITLLRFISEPQLREEITAATNKVESYNGFSAWLRFGREAIEHNDPAEQVGEQRVELDDLLLRDLSHHAGHDCRPSPARQRGLAHHPGGPGGPLAVHHREDQALRRVRHRRPHRPARSL